MGSCGNENTSQDVLNEPNNLKSEWFELVEEVVNGGRMSLSGKLPNLFQREFFSARPQIFFAVCGGAKKIPQISWLIRTMQKKKSNGKNLGAESRRYSESKIGPGEFARNLISEKFDFQKIWTIQLCDEANEAVECSNTIVACEVLSEVMSGRRASFYPA